MPDRYALSAPAPHAARVPPPAPPPGAPRPVQDDYLRRAFRYHSRTFSLAAKLLPRRVRLPVATLYLYCRTIDTLADERAAAMGACGARGEVERLRAQLEATLAGRPLPTPPADAAHALLWARLAEVHAAFRLDPYPLHQLLDGACWDIEARPIRTDADLLAYADLVAGSVGAMMLPFLVRHRTDIPALEAPARALGNAMQLTNILRDVGEDWHQLRRVYLPESRLAAHGLTPERLFAQAGVPLPSETRRAYAALVESVMAQAEALYDEAAEGIPALAPGASRGIAAAARMYREILNEIRAASYDNLTRRAVVPLGRKLARIAREGGYAARRDALAAQRAPYPAPYPARRPPVGPVPAIGAAR
ncbi:MAG: phytoene/squalene synthase family protein [Rubricoccaceae bacterium]